MRPNQREGGRGDGCQELVNEIVRVQASKNGIGDDLSMNSTIS